MSNINITRINELIRDGHKEIGDERKKNVVMIIGSTRSGKTTLACLLS